MHRVIITGFILAVSLAPSASCALDQTDGTPCCRVESHEPNSVQAILDRLERRATNLNSYQCKLDYIFKQPLLESQTRRKGVLYYAKIDKRSYLRIDFNTLQYDDEPQQKHKEQFFFDGIWGTYIDYQSHSVQRQQVAEPNAPVDAFALVSRRVPVLGFSRIEDLQQQFEIQRVQANAAETASSYQLRLTAKPDSTYHDDYVTIDVQIDKKHELPVRITAVTTEEDVHEIALAAPKTNQAIARERFTLEIPRDFSVETVPLKRSPASK
ncbi:MAG: hypothetical protein JSW27_06445 [Phycisphaerales bacterium]|nr:MAG: hypothetical protein JSW27_06445 [Phycisphaerales bacterium]